MTDRDRMWHRAERKPESSEEKRILISEAMKVVLGFTLKKHMYSFNYYKKKQRKGGPIELVLTDAIAST